MKKLLCICIIVSLLASCKKDDELPEPQREELAKKCSGCKVDRPKLNTDTIYRKNDENISH